MDVMHAREFPLCALYLELPSRDVDVNVSPSKTEVHFLEPTHVRSFIIKTLREVLAKTLNQNVSETIPTSNGDFELPKMHQTFFSANNIQHDNSFARSFVSDKTFEQSNVRAPDNIENVFEPSAFILKT